MLDLITKGREVGPQIFLVYGENGIGKSTLGANFPHPLIADLENGSKHLDVSRISAEKLPDLTSIKKLIEWLQTTPHDFKTFVIDSIESLEFIVNDAICKEGNVDSIEKYENGFGKGLVRSREIMRELMVSLQRLKEKGISTVLVGHTQVKQKNDPTTGQAWDRVVMRANDKFSAVCRDLSDNVLYCTYKIFTSKDSSGKVKAFSDGARVMYTSWRSAFDAKNRLNLPFELPLSYQALEEAMSKDPTLDAKALLEEIAEMSKGIDAKLKASVDETVKKFKDNAPKLAEVKNRLLTYVNQ